MGANDEKNEHARIVKDSIDALKESAEVLCVLAEWLGNIECLGKKGAQIIGVLAEIRAAQSWDRTILEKIVAAQDQDRMLLTLLVAGQDEINAHLAGEPRETRPSSPPASQQEYPILPEVPDATEPESSGSGIATEVPAEES